ncbi:MAG: ATP-binding protein [Candidatus Zixiibacteriota bacterium]
MNKPKISGNTITIPSQEKFLVTVDEFVERFLKRHVSDESVIADIAISVSELVINAITHAGGNSPDKLIVVEIGKTNSEVKISVSDQGHGFNPNEIDDPLADENLLKETGRGIFIVRSLMDTVDIKTSEQGTTVTITKAI